MNPTIDLDELLARMTLIEKIGQLNLVNPGGQVLTGSVANSDVHQKLIDGQVGMMFGTASMESRINIQRIATEETRLKIPMLFASDVIHGYRTALPLPIALSCSWNMQMIQRAAHLSAIEARADGIDLTFAPMVDLTRDPRWGRVAEGGGESPFLLSKIAAASVRGFQGDGRDARPSDPDRMLACVKHFAGYGAADGGREYASANLGANELHATHLPPFHAAIQAGVAAVMPGFNSLDRIPVTAHRELLTDLLRTDWRFNGAIISDYTAINELVAHGLGDLATVARLAFDAGVDVDMVGESFVSHLADAVECGNLEVTAIDAACRRVLQLKLDAGLFDDPMAYLKPDRAAEVIASAAIRDEAKQLAAASCVLLKNDDNRLPIPCTGDSQKVALIGPLVHDKSNLPGTWSVSAVADDCVPLYEGVRQWLSDQPTAVVEVLTARGCNLVDDPVQTERLNVFGETVDRDPRTDDEMIAEAVQIAEQSDIIVLTLGEAKEHSGECSSRTDLRLPAAQRRLLDALVDVDVPKVLLLFGGRPLVLDEVVDQVQSILLVWYGGTMTGPAIAELLFGVADPCGRLTMSMPRSVGQVPVHHDALPTGRPLPPGVAFEKFKSCYLDIPNDPLFSFGFGMTYTSFSFGPPSIERCSDGVKVMVDVTNQGDRHGVEVVQVYCIGGPCGPGLISRPTAQLVGFARTPIDAGQTQHVGVAVSLADLGVVHAASTAEYTTTVPPGTYRLGVGPNIRELQTIELVIE